MLRAYREGQAVHKAAHGKHRGQRLQPHRVRGLRLGEKRKSISQLTGSGKGRMSMMSRASIQYQI